MRPPNQRNWHIWIAIALVSTLSFVFMFHLTKRL